MAAVLYRDRSAAHTTLGTEALQGDLAPRELRLALPPGVFGLCDLVGRPSLLLGDSERTVARRSRPKGVSNPSSRCVTRWSRSSGPRRRALMLLIQILAVGPPRAFIAALETKQSPRTIEARLSTGVMWTVTRQTRTAKGARQQAHRARRRTTAALLHIGTAPLLALNRHCHSLRVVPIHEVVVVLVLDGIDCCGDIF